MHPTKPRGGVNPRSREDRPWKYIQRIPIDESRFPANVKPAAIIIGVRGTNHARLQDESGCCVQLRGKGISSAGTPGAEEPMHLWIKYDAPEQLEKVRSVLEEIIQSCSPSKAGNVGPARQPPPVAPPPRTQWPDMLPPKPTIPPVKPIDCFYTIHYFIHSVPNVTTANFQQGYRHFFGFPLEAKFAELGKGSIVHSLLIIPKVVRLEHTGTGIIPHVAQDVQAGAVYYVRPVLPKGIPLPVFHQHVSQATRPPPSALAPAAQPAHHDAREGGGGSAIDAFSELFGGKHAGAAPAPQQAPEFLLIQAIHAVLVQNFLQSVKYLAAAGDALVLAEVAQEWRGMPLNQVVEVFRSQMGLDLAAAKFGYPSFAHMLAHEACPEILSLEWSENRLRLRLGAAGLHPSFVPPPRFV